MKKIKKDIYIYIFKYKIEKKLRLIQPVQEEISNITTPQRRQVLNPADISSQQ